MVIPPHAPIPCFLGRGEQRGDGKTFHKFLEYEIFWKEGHSLNIEEIGIAELIPYENNPRYNENAVEAVAASIKAYGFKQPIVIDKDNVVVCGHTRLKAAKKLGLKQVPCVRADTLTEGQIKAFRLIDNKTAELASWDYELLDIEMERLDIDTELFDFAGYGDESYDFISDLVEEGFTSGKKALESTTFSMALTFPVENQQQITEYVQSTGKDEIVKELINIARRAMEGGKNENH